MKNKTLLLILTIFYLAAAGVGMSYAWGKTWMGNELERNVKEAGWKLGIFRIKMVLFLNDAGYDSNVYYGYGTATNAIKDYTFTAGPGFNFYLPLKKKIIFSIYESPQYVYYFETKRERTWNNYFNGKVHFVLNRVFITVGRGFSYAKQRWNTEIDIRPRLKEDTFESSLLWQVSKKTSFSLKYRKAKYDYENIAYDRFNIRERLNREENYANFTSYYQISYRTKIFLEAEYGLFNFEKVSSYKDSRSYRVSGGFEFSPFGIIRGRINLGYKFFDTLEKGRGDYKGLVGDTRITLRSLKFFHVRASYARDVQFSLWYDNAYFLENRAGSGASIYLSKNIRLDYDYNLGRNNYPESQLTAQGSREKRRDDYQIHSVGVYFRIKKNVGFGLIASRWIRDSNLAWEDDERNFVGVNLIYDFR